MPGVWKTGRTPLHEFLPERSLGFVPADFPHRGILTTLVLRGRVRSERYLRQLFWRLARKYHPDSGSARASEGRFAGLRSDYESALTKLHKQTGHFSTGGSAGRVPTTPGACLNAFGDLVASGFPWGAAPVPRGYSYARDRFLTILALYCPDGVESFERFESQLQTIRGDNVIWNPLFGKIKLVMLNLAAWQSTFSRRVVREWINGLKGPTDGELGIDAEAREALPAHTEVVSFLELMDSIAEKARTGTRIGTRSCPTTAARRVRDP